MVFAKTSWNWVTGVDSRASLWPGSFYLHQSKGIPSKNPEGCPNPAAAGRAGTFLCLEDAQVCDVFLETLS